MHNDGSLGAGAGVGAASSQGREGMGGGFRDTCSLYGRESPVEHGRSTRSGGVMVGQCALGPMRHV
jgi:hypothetical protein